MDEQPRVLGVVGSLRETSKTRLTVDHALEGARAAGGATTTLDLREYELPVYDADRDDAGDADRVRRHTREADAVVLGTPVYHGSYSSALKNYLDYCGFDEFEGTTVALLAVAGGRFPVPALEHLRSVGRALNAWVVPNQAALPSSGTLFEDGEFRDPDLEERVRSLGRDAVRYAFIEECPPSFESKENVGAED
jgi:NAD(P)H-dependent FMN reductase